MHNVDMSELEIVSGPALESRAEVPTLGIRETVPFRTMLSNRDRLLAELIEWMTQHGVEPDGPFFLRLLVVNMAENMDIEVGVAATGPADDRVQAGLIPAGDYAVLAYRNRSMVANKALHAWIQDRGLILDTEPHPNGEAFAARLETCVTDPRTEPRKTKWVVELAFKVRD